MRFGILACCFGLLTSILHAESATPSMEAAFLEKIKAAVAQKDFAAFSALICKDGTLDPELKAMVEKSDRDLFDKISSDAQPTYAFTPVPANQLTSFTLKGKNYRANLKPVEVLKISFPDAAAKTAAAGNVNQFPLGASFPVGIKDGALLIVHTEEAP